MNWIVIVQLQLAIVSENPKFTHIHNDLDLCESKEISNKIVIINRKLMLALNWSGKMLKL